MHILLIKTSSLGDIIHSFPALTDAQRHVPQLKVDWVVEEHFTSIPPLHPAVNRVIPVALRRWRKSLWHTDTRQEIRQFLGLLSQTSYDAVIDAQGLLKSALISAFAQGPKWGFNSKSARESLASIFYNHKISVPKTIEALTRTRQLMAAILDYPCPSSEPNSGLTPSSTPWLDQILFLPGTTWENKKWPLSYWFELAKLVKEQEFKIDIPWSNAQEHEIALYIQSAGSHVTVLPQMPLKELSERLPNYRGAIAVDSGLGYLAAAYHVPTVMIFGPTSAELLGTFPPVQKNIQSQLWCAPCRQRKCHNSTPSSVWPVCFESLTPLRIWSTLEGILAKENNNKNEG